MYTHFMKCQLFRDSSGRRQKGGWTSTSTKLVPTTQQLGQKGVKEGAERVKEGENYLESSCAGKLKEHWRGYGASPAWTSMLRSCSEGPIPVVLVHRRSPRTILGPESWWELTAVMVGTYGSQSRRNVKINDWHLGLIDLAIMEKISYEIHDKLDSVMDIWSDFAQSLQMR
ncbi:hypothetical protein llap_6304 [Limosa lapponica baueri]|uniref:Uncharacterized protein n=1 Tax=Limosa lapponica baueri TaxID=1758121 RepID=A0A2I0UBF5_LIMLA|nr:hypothetical protein llap_6304 [Limosa lapponica baueri]